VVDQFKRKHGIERWQIRHQGTARRERLEKPYPLVLALQNKIRQSQ